MRVWLLFTFLELEIWSFNPCNIFIIEDVGDSATLITSVLTALNCYYNYRNIAAISLPLRTCKKKLWNSANIISPLELKASLRWSSTSANLRTSLTSCMMYSGSELIELSESLLIKPALEHDPAPGGKKCELEIRVMPTTERLFPRLLCCSIPPANIPAAASSFWTSKTANLLRLNQVPHTS